MNGLRWQVRQAATRDLPAVLAVLNGTAARLRLEGEDQWWYGFGPDRIGPLVESGQMWVVEPPGGGLAVATVHLTADGARWCWSEAELAEPAWYVNKLAKAPWADMPDLGGWLLRWCVDRAAQAGVRYVRADVWKTNMRLQAWWRRQGWVHLQTVDKPDHYSGALYYTTAAIDLEARGMFRAGPERPAGRPVVLERHSRVLVISEPEPGTIEDVVIPSSDQPEHGELPAFPMMPGPWYDIRLDKGGRRVCGPDEVIPI